MNRPAAARRRPRLPWRDLLDVIALATWSAMLLRYWITGKLLILLHPDYAWLSHSAAIALLLLAAFKLFQAVLRLTQPLVQTQPSHVTLLPPQLSSALLLAVAVFGLIYTPRAFASDTALQRGITDTLTMTRSQPQRFVRQTASEERTIIDWVRQLNVYPEPDAYTNQDVRVQGFVIRPPDWPSDYLMISRFVLTCCAADAYPVGLPVKLTAPQADYKTDSWLEVTGKMATDTLDGKRQLVIDPTQLTPIPEPKNPYQY
ncbi:TIGR03943 family putative permease subunit [Vasconcelosia minhoensis]|uniref:TIGR03943 family putative permease subunit n=1 Tax=Vasconcelosia minhoensis TaxID=3366354 RepID=UPI002AD36F6D|nr:TIGR03943 family protein [Romeria gracilis]